MMNRLLFLLLGILIFASFGSVASDIQELHKKFQAVTTSSPNKERCDSEISDDDFLRFGLFLYKIYVKSRKCDVPPGENTTTTKAPSETLSPQDELEQLMNLYTPKISCPNLLQIRPDCESTSKTLAAFKACVLKKCQQEDFLLQQEQELQNLKATYVPSGLTCPNLSQQRQVCKNQISIPAFEACVAESCRHAALVQQQQQQLELQHEQQQQENQRAAQERELQKLLTTYRPLGPCPNLSQQRQVCKNQISIPAFEACVAESCRHAALVQQQLELQQGQQQLENQRAELEREHLQMLLTTYRPLGPCPNLSQQRQACKNQISIPAFEACVAENCRHAALVQQQQQLPKLPLFQFPFEQQQGNPVLELRNKGLLQHQLEQLQAIQRERRPKKQFRRPFEQLTALTRERRHKGLFKHHFEQQEHHKLLTTYRPFGPCPNLPQRRDSCAKVTPVASNMTALVNFQNCVQRSCATANQQFKHKKRSEGMVY